MAYLFAEKYVGIRVKIEELKGERMKKPLPIGIDDFKNSGIMIFIIQIKHFLLKSY